MKKNIFTLIALIISLLAHAQNTSVSIGPSTGMLDSTFVIPSGANVQFNASNHPGAGPYMNAEIYLCQGATLEYDFSIGTSNIVTFYMDKHSILNFPPNASGTLANFYMKDSSTLQIQSTSTIYAYMKREPNAQVAGMPISYMSDSIFNNIQFTFNGWSNPCGPTAISPELIAKNFILFQNPISSDGIRFTNTYPRPLILRLYNALGQPIGHHTIQSSNRLIQGPLPQGFIFYKIFEGETFLEAGKLLNR